MNLDFFDYYVFEDGLLKQVVYEPDVQSLFLAMDVPISHLHPDYSHVKHFFGAMLRNRVYLNDDVRHLELYFAEVNVLEFKINEEKSRIDKYIKVEHAFRPIMMWEVKKRAGESPIVLLRADEIELVFLFNVKKSTVRVASVGRNRETGSAD